MDAKVTYVLSAIPVTLFFLLPTFAAYKLRRSEVIHRRSPFLLIVGGIYGAGCGLLSLAAMDYFTGALSFFCYRKLIVSVLLYPPFLLTYFLRASLLVCLDTIQRHRLEIMKQMGDGDFEQRKKMSLNLVERICFFFHQGHLKQTTFHNSNVAVKSTEGAFNSTINNTSKKSNSKVRSSWFLQLTQSFEFVMTTWLLGYYIIAGIIILVTMLVRSDLYGIPCNPDSLWGMNGLRILLTVSCAFLLFRVNSIHDKLSLKRELLASTFTFMIGLILYLCGNYIKDIRWIGPSFWTGSSIIICHTITVIGPVIQSIKRIREAKSFNVNQETFKSILNNRESFEILKAMMAEEFCLENALFIERYRKIRGAKVPDIMNAADTLQSGSTPAPLNAEDSSMSIQAYDYAVKASKDIRAIYDDFIRINSVYELNVSPSLKRQVEEIICERSKSGGMLTVDLIEPVAVEVYRLVYQNTFRRFIKKHRELAQTDTKA